MAQLSISSRLIDLLLKRGMTVGAIANAIVGMRYFVSRVKDGAHRLSIERLVAPERGTDESLPLLL
jgi:hypothetical protein